MKIESNKTFECYETACESWYSGKDITLDGVKLIPITVLDEMRAEIEEIIGERNLDDYDFCSGLICARKIIDKYRKGGE